ncbi:hypothetical protein CS379_14255 [Methylobacterium frigidaeris]|nr:hypothetical protein CS379_14255 [Methylobacterium frigidaeris]
MPCWSASAGAYAVIPAAFAASADHAVTALHFAILGATLVTLAGSGVSGDGTDANASRAIQGIITRSGFPGAGRDRDTRERRPGARPHHRGSDLGDGGAWHGLSPATLLVGGVVCRTIDDKRKRREDGK